MRRKWVLFALRFSMPYHPDLALYLVIGPTDCGGRDLLWVVDQALKGGVSCLQFRNKNEHVDLSQVIGMQHLSQKYGVPFVVNDSLSLALAIKGAGIHIGQGDCHPLEIRKQMGPQAWIGLSVGSQKEKQRLDEAFDAVDYVGVGPAYTTSSKHDAGVVLDSAELKQLGASLGKPWVAIGGICESNVPAVMATGAHGIAVISAIAAAPDPRQAAETLRDTVERHKTSL